MRIFDNPNAVDRRVLENRVKSADVNAELMTYESYVGVDSVLTDEELEALITPATTTAGLAAYAASTCTATNSFVADLGCGFVASSTVFPPTWGAAASVFISSTFVI